MTAYHEAGHTLVSLLTDGAMKVHKVTILGAGNARGFTSMLQEDEGVVSRKTMQANIDVNNIVRAVI